MAPAVYWTLSWHDNKPWQCSFYCIVVCVHDGRHRNPEHMTFLRSCAHRPSYPNQKWPSAFLMKAGFLANLFPFSTTSTGHLSLRWSDLCCALRYPATFCLPFIRWATLFVLLELGFFWDLWLSIYGPYQPHTRASAILTCPEPW